MRQMKVRTTFFKMTVSFLVFGLIPLFLLSILFFSRYSGIVRDNLVTGYQTMNSYAAKNVAAVITSADEALGDLYDYRDPEGKTLTDILRDNSENNSEQEQEISRALLFAMGKSPYLSSIRLSDRSGRIYSLYANPEKTLKSDFTKSMTIHTDGPDDKVTRMKLFGTFPEEEICVNSEDYVFSIARNYMDTTKVSSSCSEVLAYVFADVNISRIRDVVEEAGFSPGRFYIYSTSTGQYLYSDSDTDYRNGAHPLAFCENLFGETDGAQQIGSHRVFFDKIENVDAYAVLVMDQSDLMGIFFQSRIVLILILCFSCAVLLILYMMFSIRMSAPARKLKEAMEQVEKGNLDVHVDLETRDEMGYVADGFNKMTKRLKDYINRVYVAEICRKDAELNALKMQIQPHFLYNSLDVIRMTALDQEDAKTARLLESLAKQLRYVMGTQSERILLKDELDAIREYFVLAKERYEGRISLMVYAADEDRNLFIPKLLLQPVVENAIRHGLREKQGNGAIAIRAERKSDCLEIVVMDDGLGMEEEKVEHIRRVLEDPDRTTAVADRSVSIGMQNVYDRIKLNCGKEYGFSIQSTPGTGTIVTFRLPVWEEG